MCSRSTRSDDRARSEEALAVSFAEGLRRIVAPAFPTRERLLESRFGGERLEPVTRSFMPAGSLPTKTGIGRLHFPPHSYRAPLWRFRGRTKNVAELLHVSGIAAASHRIRPNRVGTASAGAGSARRGFDFVQFRFRRMRLPPLTETAERIAHESFRPVSNNNVYLTRTELSSPPPH
jgi:hypothetical protein